MFDFLGKYSCKIIKPLNKGLSDDEKYYIKTEDGNCLLLRLNDIAEYENKKIMFEMMKRVAVLDISMTKPVEFGICDNGKKVYQLLTWCEGEKAEELLPELSDSKQYELGLKSGEFLRKIHSIKAPDNLEDWSKRYLDTNIVRINAFRKCGVKVKGSDSIYKYFEEYKHLLYSRPQCLHHGDYHNGNLLINDNCELSIIDWELLDYGNYGDPWEEFNRIGSSQIIPHFSSGQIQGYFGGEPPQEFWHLFALYLSAGALMLVSWAAYIQKDELEYSIENANNVLQWFDNMINPVPSWYIKKYSSK